MNFQMSVIEHLKEKGFNCIIQKSAFPDIVAWKPFSDGKGNSLALNAQANVGGRIARKVFFPFFVSFVECRANKHLSKKENEIVKKILEEGRCNAFLVAYKDKKKLKFQEIELKGSTAITKDIKEPLPSYLG